MAHGAYEELERKYGHRRKPRKRKLKGLSLVKDESKLFPSREAKIAEAKKMHLSGYTFGAIAKRVGLPKSTVHRQLTKKEEVIEPVDYFDDL